MSYSNNHGICEQTISEVSKNFANCDYYQKLGE